MRYTRGRSSDLYTHLSRRFIVAASSLGGTALLFLANDTLFSGTSSSIEKKGDIGESGRRDRFSIPIGRQRTLCQPGSSPESSLSRPSPVEATSESNSKSSSNNLAPYPSWIRRTLAYLRLASLPLPRVILKHDPDLMLPQRRIRERQWADEELRNVQLQIRTALEQGDQKRVGTLLKRSYELLYGPGVLPQDRQSFLERYGCTGWTEDILVNLLELDATRGFVEIGAGNGQWARVLNDRFRETEYAAQQKKRNFEFCLAYDNMSQLPLNPDIYHKHTQPYHDYFYSNVQPCESISNTLMHWRCRGRILLLVYPSPDDMAVTAIQEYAQISTLNDTVVYVGEGRGGANANGTFFDYLENGEWILWQILPVKSFGTKGFEKLYIFKRRIIVL